MTVIVTAGLCNAAAAAILALAMVVVGRFGRRPAWTHAVALLVLAKLVAPPLWRFNLADASADPTGQVVAVETFAGQVMRVGEIDEIQPGAAVRAAFTTDSTPRPLDWLGRNWAWPVGVAWAAGSLGWMASATVRIIRFGRVLRLASLAPKPLQEQADLLATRLGMRRSPPVWIVPGAISPLVWALGGRARLLLPRDLWAVLDDDQKAALLTHELAHVHRRDHWIRWIELASTALYWWCPVQWWARRVLREAEEQCCDAWVVWAQPGATRAYASALLDTIDFLASTRPAVPLTASGAGYVHHLERRLTMILRGLTPKAMSPFGRFAVAGLAALLLPLAPSFGGDEPKPDDSKAAGKIIVVGTDSDLGLDFDLADMAGLKVVLDDSDDEQKPGDKNRGDARKAVRRVRVERQGRDAKEVKPTPELKAEVEKARAELKDAEAALAKAAKKLADAEAKAGLKTFEIVEFRPRGGPQMNVRFQGRPGPGGNDRPNPPGPPREPRNPPRAVSVTAKVESDRDSKLDALEKKLDALVAELKALKTKPNKD